MKFPRNAKILRSHFDVAPFAAMFFLLLIFLMPLAGTVGMHVASTPTSKPSIPSAPGPIDDDAEELEEPFRVVDGSSADADGDDDDFDPEAAAGASVGDLAAKTKKSSLASHKCVASAGGRWRCCSFAWGGRMSFRRTILGSAMASG